MKSFSLTRAGMCPGTIVLSLQALPVDRPDGTGGDFV